MPRSKEYQKTWRERNADKIARNYQRFLDSQKNARRDRATWADAQLTRLKYKAKRLNLPFDLKAGDIVAPLRCPVLGVRLRYDATRGPHGPTIDRIIPKKGYTKKNVCVISALANAWKCDCTDANQLRRVADYIERATRKRYVK